MSQAESGDQVVSQVGEDLRTARQRLGWDLPQVAAGLRIRLPYLSALEEGRIADLPGNAYAVGFLRTYASSLGLDPDEMARRFRAEAKTVDRKPELAFPAPVPDRGVPAGAVVLLGMVLAIGGYVTWYRMSGDATHRVEAVTAVPERLAALADPPPAGLPPAPAATASVVASASANANPGAAVPAFTTPAPAASPAAVASISPSQAAAAVMPSPLTSPSLTAAPAPPAAAPVAAGGLPLTAPTDGGRMVLRARADAWVQVRDRQGQVLLNRVLRANESWPVPNRPNLLLTTGNAGGTDVLVDGTAAPGFGGAGVVRRDVPLDPDLIKAGRLPVQMASTPVPASTGPSSAGPTSTAKPSAQ